MKLFGRTSGYYLFWTGFVYFCVGMYLAFTHAAHVEYASAVWVLVLALPFLVPPVGRYFNMDVDWDRKMFNWFGKKNGDDSNVVKFPEVPKLEVKTPEPEAKKEEPSKVFYRLGLTDNNRVALSMGYSEITMNHTGCQQLIDQITFFQSQLTEEEVK